MPLTAVLLVLAAAVCHSAWNLALKTAPRRHEVWFVAMASSVIVAVPLLAIYRVTDVTPAGWGLVLASAVFETAYFIALTAAYEVGELSLVYPIARGTAPLVVAPLAIALLGERPSVQGLVGVGLVVAGIWGSYVGAFRSAGASPESRRALVFALLTGLMTAGYSLVNKVGVRVIPVPLYAFLVMLLNTVMIALVLSRRGALPSPSSVRGHAGRAALVGVLMMAAYVGVLAAMAIAPVTYVVAAREVSIVAGAVLGAVVLGERHPGARIAGAALIFAGVVVLALSR